MGVVKHWPKRPDPRPQIVSPESQRFNETRERSRHVDRQNLKDQARRNSETVAPDGGVPSTLLEAQLGRPLSVAEIKKRLLRMNPNLVFELSKADPRKEGIYVQAVSRDPITGIVDTEKQFVGGMESGYSTWEEVLDPLAPQALIPEFSVRHTEEDEAPDMDIPGQWRKELKFKSETRGWRTVLAYLIKQRLITPAQCEKEFQISRGRSSQNWQQQKFA